MRKSILCVTNQKLIYIIGLAVLILIQSTGGMTAPFSHEDVTPTPTPEQYTVILPDVHLDTYNPYRNRGLLVLFPEPWQPFLRRYGMLMLLVIAVSIWIGVQRLKKRRPRKRRK